MSRVAERILPAEIWSIIVNLLPYSSKIWALGVSRALHAALVPLLFSSIKIYVVTAEMQELFKLTDYEVEDLMHHSWEKLDHISRDEWFACQVKTLTVCSYGQRALHFEKFCLLRTIKSLPHLKAFHWIGAFSPSVIHIVHSLPTHTKVLQTSGFTLPEWPEQLTGLKCLDMGSIVYHPSEAGYYTDDLLDCSALQDLIDPLSVNIHEGLVSNARTLQFLCIRAEFLVALPISVTSSLKELEIVAADGETAGLDLVVRHAQVLESLSIVGFVAIEALQILEQNCDAIPHLTSFRLSCEVYENFVTMTEEHAVGLSTFLHAHQHLRRLYLRIAGARWDVLCNLKPALQELHSLQVLGLHLGRVHLSTADIEQVTSVLGDRLNAVHLTIPWTHSSLADVDVNTLQPLLQRIKELRLTYLHLFSLGRPLPVSVEELAHEVTSLETIGLNRRLWDEDGDDLWEWNPRTLVTATEEDFRNKDYYWLFKYH